MECGCGGEQGALREYRERVGSRAGEFQGFRFDPFEEDMRWY